MLGLKWHRRQDILVIPEEETQPMKQGSLGKTAKIYDPFGLIAPLTRKRLSGYLHLQSFKGCTSRVNSQPGDRQLYCMSQTMAVPSSKLKKGCASYETMSVSMVFENNK